MVGSINNVYATRDFYNNKINDPWPTPFPSSGFDFDAIGVIHQSTVTGIHENKFLKDVVVYPNPVKTGEDIYVNDLTVNVSFELLDASGKIIIKTEAGEERGAYSQESATVATTGLSAGLYCLKIISENNILIKKIVISD